MRKSSPASEARERDYYRLKKGSPDELKLEEALSEVEAKAAPLLHNAQRDNWLFTNDEKAQIAFFAAQLFYRGPAAREFFAKNVDFLLQVVEDPQRSCDPAFLALHKWVGEATGAGLSVNELRTRLAEERKDPGARRRRELFMLVRLAPLFAHVFSTFRWQVWETRQDHAFVTSDTPVITLRPRDDGLADLGVGLFANNARVYFPLCRTKCLVMMQQGSEGRRDISPSLVRMINRALLSCAKRFVYAPFCSPVFSKLVDKVGCRLVYGVNCFNQVQISTTG